MRFSSLIFLPMTLFLVNCADVKFDHGSGTALDAQSLGTSDQVGGSSVLTGDEASGAVSQPADVSANSSGSANSGGSSSSGNSSSGSGSVGGNGSATYIPRVVFVGPPCQRGSSCLVEFRLDKAYALKVDFDWLTDDSLYLSQPSIGGVTVGRAGLHYVSTAGHISFSPGETVKKVYVQNINPYNIEILIGVRMRNCNYGGAIGKCSDFFR